MLYKKQSDGKERVIAYASWSLNHAEHNYDAHKLEFLALKLAVTDCFHEYLYGGTFDVFTDNNPLTYILTTAKLDAMGHRRVASLGPYHFNLHYKQGKLNSDADALSRIDWRSVMAEEVKATMDLTQVDRTVIVEPSVFEDTLENVPIMKSLQTESVTKKWQQRQKQDPEMRAIVQMIKDDTWEHYRYSKKKLYFTNKALASLHCSSVHSMVPSPKPIFVKSTSVCSAESGVRSTSALDFPSSSEE